MSYNSMVEMAGSQSLLTRIVAAAAEEGVGNPLQWTQERIWHFVTAEGWADAWDYARATATDDVNPDTGRRPSVITDEMILAAVRATVQTIQAAANGAPAETPAASAGPPAFAPEPATADGPADGSVDGPAHEPGERMRQPSALGEHQEETPAHRLHTEATD